MIGSETIAAYLERLAAREPTPGGGAAGALHAAQGAALISMVARYTTGSKYAEHEQESARILARAGEIVPAALRVADDDEEAFGAVIAAYRLPSDSEEHRAVRSGAIQRAVLEAARPPRALIGLAAEIVELADQLADFGNRNVLSDVSAAAEAARAAAATALVTLDINIAAIDDPGTRDELRRDVLLAEQTIEAADLVSGRVRGQVAA